jgi:methylmalonyl-CoA mutase C-terminal domain/subunit
MDRPIRVLIAKVGLDGHDRGAKVIASALRDAGMEVIYTGLRETPESVVAAALQEDVDVIGVSSLSGAHRTIFDKLLAEIDAKDLNDVILLGGGVIPKKDIEMLEERGVDKIFTPGTSMDAIVSYIQDRVAEQSSSTA